jgi:hypothetical protein
VKTAFVESVPEGADAERILTQFARDGYKVIFATSFGYMDAVSTWPKSSRRPLRALLGLQDGSNASPISAGSTGRYLSESWRER